MIEAFRAMLKFPACLLASVLIVSAFFSMGCFQPERPRSINAIRTDMATLDTLYLTEDGQEVIAPGDEREIIVDPATGKLASRALECNNPNCPQRNADGSPHTFARLDPFAHVEGGEVRIRQPMSAEEEKQVQDYFEQKRMCPACLENRNLKSETEEEKQKYLTYVQAHMLPESAKRLEELNEEYRAYVKKEQERTGN